MAHILPKILMTACFILKESVYAAMDDWNRATVHSSSKSMPSAAGAVNRQRRVGARRVCCVWPQAYSKVDIGTPVKSFVGIEPLTSLLFRHE